MLIAPALGRAIARITDGRLKASSRQLVRKTRTFAFADLKPRCVETSFFLHKNLLDTPSVAAIYCSIDQGDRFFDMFFTAVVSPEKMPLFAKFDAFRTMATFAPPSVDLHAPL